LAEITTDKIDLKQSGFYFSQVQRLARAGDVVVMSFKDHDRLLIKDLMSGFTKAIRPKGSPSNLSQYILSINFQKDKECDFDNEN